MEMTVEAGWAETDEVEEGKTTISKRHGSPVKFST